MSVYSSYRETLKHSIIHKPLLDYSLMASEQERADMIEQLRERLVKLLHTNEGFRVAMQCVWHGTAKVCEILKYIPGAPKHHQA